MRIVYIIVIFIRSTDNPIGDDGVKALAGIVETLPAMLHLSVIGE